MSNEPLACFPGGADGGGNKESHDQCASNPKYASSNVDDTKQPDYIGHFLSFCWSAVLYSYLLISPHIPADIYSSISAS
jgi:hypothetical protein